MLRSERVWKAFAEVATMVSVFLDLSRRAFDLSKIVGLIDTPLR